MSNRETFIQACRHSVALLLCSLVLCSLVLGSLVLGGTGAASARATASPPRTPWAPGMPCPQLQPLHKPQEDSAEKESTIVAWVGETPIFEREVTLQLEQATRAQPVEGEALQRLQATAVEQLVGQRLVLQYLAEEGERASDREVDLAIDDLKRRLEARGQSIEDYLQSRQIDLRLLRYQFEWRMSWQRYLEATLTEENLRNYFQDHAREFDGTQRRIAQIFFRPDLRTGDSPAARRVAAQQLAEEVREKFASGQADFTELAEEFSDAPTAVEGGRLGWFTRRGELPEPLLVAAFALKKNELSQPIETSYGVHLVLWDAEQPGQRPWKAVEDQVRQAATRYLFQWIAERQRTKVEVRFARDFPHFDPLTGTLMSPKPASDRSAETSDRCP